MRRSSDGSVRRTRKRVSGAGEVDRVVEVARTRQQEDKQR